MRYRLQYSWHHGAVCPALDARSLPCTIDFSWHLCLLITNYKLRMQSRRKIGLLFLIIIGVIIGFAIKNVKVGLIIGLIIGLLAGSLGSKTKE